MANEKNGWDDIPSISGLEVDWSFEPENPLGNRAYARLTSKELHTIFGVTKIPTKVVSADMDLNNVLMDVSQNGMAVLSGKPISLDEPVKVGFFLKSHKIISRAKVKNVTPYYKRYRIGMEFIGLDNKATAFINSLIASQAHQH